MKTPITDDHYLDLASTKTAVLGQHNYEELWANWAYKLGLKLDKIIPLQGYTNAQRIELAIQKFIESEDGEIVKQAHQFASRLADELFHKADDNAFIVDVIKSLEADTNPKVVAKFKEMYGIKNA